MEETHKEDGLEVNFPLQCNSNKHIKHKLQMEIMGKEHLWYKLRKARDELKLVKPLVFQVINSNNSMQSHNPRLQLQTQGIDFDEKKSLIFNDKVYF